MITRVARASARRPVLVLLAWLVVAAAGVLLAPGLFDRLTSEAGTVDDSRSVRAGQQLDDAAPEGPAITAVADDVDASDAEVRTQVVSVAERVGALPGVESVVTPYLDGTPQAAEAAAAAVAADGRAVAVHVTFAPTEEGWSAVDGAADVLRELPGDDVVVGGGPLQDDEMEQQAADDLARAELLSMPVVLVVLVIVFGGLLAAALPVVLALVGVAATLAALALISTVADVSVYAVNVITMLGLGLAVDYALLLVSRYREERALDPVGALERTYATAGRTVAYSGLIVAASLAGLLVMPDDFLRSMGLAGMAVVLLDLVAALTLLPALLALLGPRVGTGRPGTGRGFARTSSVARRHRWVVAGVVTGLLALAVVPFLGARYADPDARSLPESSATRQLADLAPRFGLGVGGTEPLTVVGQGEAAPAELESYVAELRALPGVRAVAEREGVEGLTVVDVLPVGTTQGGAAMDLVEAIRALPAPVEAEVTGAAAELLDYQTALVDRLPWALAVVVAATAVLLFLFTGSVVIPVKAVLMNALTLGVSLGTLVWVFQDGNLGALVGTEALGSLAVTTPVLVAAIAFGLSMDYEVFLLGRIVESYRRTGDHGAAVDEGLARTGRTVTAAAVLMAVVFAGFVAGGFSPVKQIGLGLVVAVLVDATLVRMLLLPSVLAILGTASWWAPAPLRRLHARIGLDEGVGSASEQGVQAPAALSHPQHDTAVSPTGSSA